MTGLLLVLLLQAGPGEDWPSVRGDAEARASCRWEPGVFSDIQEWHFQGKMARRYRPGLAVWASPAVVLVEGRPWAFIGGYDQTMHALDIAGKTRRWFKVTNGAIGSSPAVGEVGGTQVVFWGSSDRTVYAHTAAEGRRVWTREVAGATSTSGEADLSSPLLHEGTLYLTCFVHDRAISRNDQKGWLLALRMSDGGELWRVEVSQGPVGSPVGRRLGGRFHLFLASRRGLVQAFDVSGERPERRWTYQMPHEVFGSPCVEEGTEDPLLFLGSKFGSLVALEARTGRERWKRMAGNWIDNTACTGEIAGRRGVIAGSHDYCVYAFSREGEELWRCRLGGEVYSAPCLFRIGRRTMVAAAALDNRVYVVDGETGGIVTSFHTGAPIWDKVAKGETLWGSPAAIEAGEMTALVHGSFNDTVYVLPVQGECTLRSQVRSAGSLWLWLGVAAAAFLGAVLPLTLRWTRPPER